MSLVRWRARSVRAAPFVLGALLAGVLVYAALLRLDTLFARYGPLTHPRWVVALQTQVQTIRDGVVPAGWTWDKVDRPYVGGDPLNYLRFAREMRRFYQGHVREPVFLATTRLFLVLTEDQDVSVSFASLTFSILAVFGTYLLGSAVVSPGVGLAAAAALAVEREVVAWSPEGWRDDAFAAMVCLSAWSIVRFWRHQTWRSAAVAGALGAAACLTRITALSFLVPAIAATALSGGVTAWRRSLPRAALAMGVMVVLVAPYLINCYLEYGDPLHAINVHTHFYRSRLGAPSDADQTALSFISDRFRSRPIAAADTAYRGLVVYPFSIKWSGWDSWMPRAGQTLSWLSAAGLFIWLWQPVGRLVLLILGTSLVPYMMTWSIPGGDAWRFTMHAYPFYLIAAFAVVALATRTVRDVLAAGPRAPSTGSAIWRRVGVLAALAAIAWLHQFWSPLLVAREALLAGDATTLGAGPHDGVFFRDGWSQLVTTGAVVTRFATSNEAALHVPLPEERPYRLDIRMDPVPRQGAPAQRVRVFLDRVPVGILTLDWHPERVGSYTIDVPASLAGRRFVRLALLADRVEPAGKAAALYPGVTPSQPAAFRLWYVRVTPL